MEGLLASEPLRHPPAVYRGTGSGAVGEPHAPGSAVQDSTVSSRWIAAAATGDECGRAQAVCGDQRVTIQIKLMGALRSRLPAGSQGGKASMQLDSGLTITGLLEQLGLSTG